MAVCRFCGKEKTGAASCRENRIVIDGMNYHPVPFKKKSGSEFKKEQAPARCPDCNVMDGGYHHVGCSLEICPKCGFRWVMCRCSGFKKTLETLQPSQNGTVIPLKPFKEKH